MKPKRVQIEEDREPLLPVAGPSSGGAVPNSNNTNANAVKKEPVRLPKRTTKTAQKLTLFPEGLNENVFLESESTVPDDPLLPHVTAKTQKEHWLSKLERKWLPRVTAYCTANSYHMDNLMEHLRKKNHIHRAAPKRFDEVIYTPFTFNPIKELAAQHANIPDFSVGGANEASDPASVSEMDNFFDQNIDASGKSIPGSVSYDDLAKRIAPIGELLYFDYGVIVMWGFTASEEKKILDDLVPFQEDTVEPESVETEQFYFHYNTYYQPRIYNDIITLKNPANFMLKITISHAIAQSVKLTLFEGLIEETIESTRHIPRKMAKDGKIHMSRKAINQKIGQLFIMRINVNLVSNVLDTPEIFWSEPAMEPLYRAIRGYLEISQRLRLLPSDV
ncbi:hypothetical protein HDV03_004411 [Kappamyces sp. JEL0829]|nr:hypothetical protein HDV03_004411 [Kappamyces sp. JEL0829]